MEKEEVEILSEPMLKFYWDEERTNPLELINEEPQAIFEEIDADEVSVISLYVINFGNRDLRKMTFTPNDTSVKVLEYPVELPVGITAKVVLMWQPLKGRELDATLVIKGKYYKGR